MNSGMYSATMAPLTPGLVDSDPTTSALNMRLKTSLALEPYVHSARHLDGFHGKPKMVVGSFPVRNTCWMYHTSDMACTNRLNNFPVSIILDRKPATASHALLPRVFGVKKVHRKVGDEISKNVSKEDTLAIRGLANRSVVLVSMVLKISYEK